LGGSAEEDWCYGLAVFEVHGENDVRREDVAEIQLVCCVDRLRACGGCRVVRREEEGVRENDIFGRNVVEERGDVMLVLEQTSDKKKRWIGEKRTSSSAMTTLSTSAVWPWVTARARDGSVDMMAILMNMATPTNTKTATAVRPKTRGRRRRGP
jgi:hypothetical protein